MEETLDLVESLKQRFKVEKIQPYGQVIPVPSKLFDPSWEATLESQGHRVYVNAMNGEPFCFVSVRKGKPRHVDPPKVTATAKPTVPPIITQKTLLRQKPRTHIKTSSSPQERLPQGRLVLVPIELLRHSTINPRESFKEVDLQALAVTIERHGLLQPILVRELHDQYGYEVVVGERRLRACKIIGLQTVPCIVVGDLDREQLLEMMLVENLCREDLTVYEELKIVKVLKKLGLSDKEIGVRCGMSHGRAGQLAYLAEHLPEQYQHIIASGRTRTHNPKAFTQQKAMLVAKVVASGQLPSDELRNVVRLITEEGITATGLAKKLATKPKEKVKRVFSDASKQYWRQLTKDLRAFARYWPDNCKLEEWEDTEKRYLRLEVWLKKDLSEED